MVDSGKYDSNLEDSEGNDRFTLEQVGQMIGNTKTRMYEIQRMTFEKLGGDFKRGRLRD